MRRHRLLSLFLASSLGGLAVGPAHADTYPRQPGVDVERYTFRVTLSDDTDAIDGETTVAFRVVKDGVTTLTLDLIQPKPGALERGMTVSAVAEGATPVAFEHRDDRLTIRLATPGRAGETRSVTVRYRGIPITGLLIAPNKHGERSFFSDNWPIKARQWLPTVDHPSDKAGAEMIVNAPAHYQVVSNGRLVEERDMPGDRRLTHWRQPVPMATWLNALGVSRFAVDHRPDWRGIPIDTWVYPQDRDNGFALFAKPTRDVLDFFSERVGPYSFERLGHVQANGVRGGMESATSIFYGDDSVNDPASPRWRDVITHEMAHQWFGNAVTEADWDDVWLSEGFATYFTHLFVEHSLGRDEFVRGLRADRDAIREFDLKNPDYRIVHDNIADMEKILSSAGTYKKGGWTLHMLRGVIGDDAFWKGIRDYYGRYRNGNASTADFRRAMEAASGQPLAWFFDQWLTRGGFLKVSAAWSYDAAAKMLRLEVDQKQPGAPLRMPIEVGVTIPGEALPRVLRMEIRGPHESVALPLDKEPSAIALDPRTLVLMEADVARR